MVAAKRSASTSNASCAAISPAAAGGSIGRTATVNGIALPAGLRKNAKLPEPIFTPAAKNDVGHDEDIPFDEMARRVGAELAEELRERSLSCTSSPATIARSAALSWRTASSSSA